MGLDMALYIKKDNGDLGEVVGWRKFNALHRWFIEQHNNSVDDQTTFPVSKDSIECLITDLTDSVKTKEPFLTPMDGFFFGSTDIDDDYWLDVNDAIAELKRVIKDYPDVEDFYYSAWW